MSAKEYLCVEKDIVSYLPNLLKHNVTYDVKTEHDMTTTLVIDGLSTRLEEAMMDDTVMKACAVSRMCSEIRRSCVHAL